MVPMKKKILMVDDESQVRYTVKHGLETLDKSFEITAVENGQACFKELEKEKPDLILLDVMMPEMSGWMVYDTIRDNKEWERIPIIFLTARTDDIARRAGEFIAEDFLEKPVDLVELKKRINDVLTKEE